MSQKKVLIPLPNNDFDPTECGIPWKLLKAAKVSVTFATPQGKIASCDQRMLYGHGLGPLKFILSADENGFNAYQEMSDSPEFKSPISWENIITSHFDGVILPGGHAPGMKEYLESTILQSALLDFFKAKKIIGAICHGVVLAARTQMSDKKSILFGHKVTSLLAQQEKAAWLMTCLWLGNYYRTYPITVESEVKGALAHFSDFLAGPMPLFRDSLANISRGFVVRDGHFISARWPGDAHHFGQSFLAMLLSK